MKLFVTLSALLVAVLLVRDASAAPSPAKAKKIDPATATLDFIRHEQAAGQAEQQPASLTPVTTPSPYSPPRQGGDTQQRLQPNPNHHQQRQNASSTPKRDWELVPPHQAVLPTPRQPYRPPASRPTPSFGRPTTPTYAGVLKNRQQDADGVALPSLPPLSTPRPRIYNVPVKVEGGDYTTKPWTWTSTTETSRWYDKFFGRGADADQDSDSPWGRRRRQAPPTSPLEERKGEEREEVVIGSNYIRVKGNRTPSGQSRPRQGQSS